MTYHVIVTQRAKEDLRHYYSVAAKHVPGTAAEWLNRFEEALTALSAFPARCPLAPENDLMNHTIHQLLFGKRLGRHPALFTIDGDRVIILHIRRGSMDKPARKIFAKLNMALWRAEQT